MTLNEINQFFDSYDKVESRIKEVAPLCTKICESEEITRFSRDIDGDIRIGVKSQYYGDDVYYFPLEYLSMTNDEIVKCEKKKAERERRRVAREAREEKKSRERQERREYERLKKKYEGGAKKHTSQEKTQASCVKCGCRLFAKTALDYDVSGSTHRFICAECAEEEGLEDMDNEGGAK